MTTRTTTLDNIDPNAPMGTLPWANSVTILAVNKLRSVKSRARTAAITISHAEEGKAWKAMGYSSFDAWLVEEVGISPAAYKKLQDLDKKMDELIDLVEGIE